MTDAHRQFSQIKDDLRRQQRDIYNEKARIISIPDGKIVYIRNDSPSHTRDLATRFIRNFDGPYVVTGHPYGRTDLLTLRHIASGKDLSHPINIEKVVAIPEPEFNDLQPPNDAIIEMEADVTQDSSPGISTNFDLNHLFLFLLLRLPSLFCSKVDLLYWGGGEGGRGGTRCLFGLYCKDGFLIFILT